MAKQFLTKETFRKCLHKMADGKTWELKGINGRGGKDTIWLKKHGSVIEVSSYRGSNEYDLNNEGKELELHEGWNVVDLMWNDLTSGHGLHLYVKNGIMERLSDADGNNENYGVLVSDFLNSHEDFRIELADNIFSGMKNNQTLTVDDMDGMLKQHGYTELDFTAEQMFKYLQRKERMSKLVNEYI